MTDDKKELLQKVIDRLLYCDDYRSKLEELNSQFNPNQKQKFTTNQKEFMFPLDKAI